MILCNQYFCNPKATGRNLRPVPKALQIEMKAIIPVNSLENLIFEFRGIKVMIDTDLAALYETPTKRLKEQVTRNIDRFPDDFMFELKKEEKEHLISFAPRLSKLKHSYVAVMVFTEQGVAMLSSVLRSDRAVKINIEIMRAFARYRAILLENKEIRQELKDLDEKLNQAFKYLLSRIDALTPKYTKRKRIGYRRADDKG